ncbi:E1-E2 ATPase-domain-containing protein [Armillaria mellea]|nr:E1-E2 ATPase-domain-containing protein [Armillaria mellea]
MEPMISPNQPPQEVDLPCSCCSGEDDIEDKPALTTPKPESIALRTGASSVRSKTSGRESCCGAPCCKIPVRRGRRSRFLWKRKTAPCCSRVDEHHARHTTAADPSLEGQEEQEKVLTLMITGMDCPACTPRVERALKSLGVGDIKVDFLGARASCSYISGSTDPETIRRKVEKATGFLCAIASLRNGQRTLRISFADVGTPTLETLQNLLGREQEILKLSKTDFRFTVDSSARYATAHEIHAALLDKGWVASPVNEDDDETAIDEAAMLDFRRSISRFILSAVLTIPVLVLAWSHGYNSQFTLRGGISLGLASLIQIFCAGHIVVAAGRAVILDHHLDADVLIALSSLSAFLYSAVSYGYNVANHSVELDSFFETSALLITLILLGRLISVYARNAARRSSVGLTPPPVEVAHWLDPKAAEVVRDIHTALLDVGDTITVHAGEILPSDGIVSANMSDIDESLITGEAVPITKGLGASVLAGTTVLGPQSLYVRVSKTVQDNSLAELRRLTAEARSSRARIQDTADRIAQRIIPIVLGVASIAFLVWALVLKFARGESSGKAVADGLSYAVAILALSCPCALTLCVPLVILYARIVSQKPPFSLLFRSSAALQHARIVTHVIFDKTGTLTTGKMRVVKAVFNKDYGLGSAQGLIKGLVAGSEHPVSAAVGRSLAAESEELDDVETVVGKGIQANWNGSILRGGSVSWCAMQDEACVVNMLNAGKSVFVVTIDNAFLAAFGLEDDLRPESSEVVSSLVAQGILVSILSGDHQKAVDGVCRQLGVEGVQAKGNCLPEDKRDIVRMTSWSASCAQDDVEFGHDDNKNRARTTQGRSQEKNIVVFVGDGSNDTAALAQADIGVSLVSGTAIAINSADVVILSGGLKGLLQTIKVSRMAWRRILLSLVWALSYNVLAVLFGSGLLVEVRIEPQWAGLGELASLVPVLLIAQSCRFFK